MPTVATVNLTIKGSKRQTHAKFSVDAQKNNVLDPVLLQQTTVGDTVTWTGCKSFEVENLEGCSYRLNIVGDKDAEWNLQVFCDQPEYHRAELNSGRLPKDSGDIIDGTL